MGVQSSKTKVKLQGGLFLVTGLATFTSTATSVEVNAGGLGHLVGYKLQPHSAYGANDRLYLNETAGNNNQITVDADGEVTVARAASGTSGLTLYYEFVGF